MTHSAGPLGPARGRLRDAGAHIGEAQAEYGDPLAFRKAINAALQAMRNAENLVRSHRSLIPGFDAWYAPWLSWMKSNRYLRWLVDARNTVVHKADLEFQSKAEVTVVFSYNKTEQLRGPTPADPKKASLTIARDIRTLMLLDPNMPRHGVIKVERKWLHSGLGDAEVLSTLIYCHYCLRFFVLDCVARLLDTSPPGATPPLAEIHKQLDSGTPDKIAVTAELRTVSIELETGEPMYVRTLDRERPRGLPSPEEHYGVTPVLMPIGKGVSLRDLVDFFQTQARVVMRVDGHHLPLVFLFREGMPVKTIGMQIGNNSQKYALWEQVAKQVESAGADRVLSIGEAWAAPFSPDAQHERPAESLQRREYLHIAAIDSGGEYLDVGIPIGRVAGEPLLGTPVVLAGRPPAFFSAIQEVWHRQRSE